jgi:hypothetical protein
MMIPGYPKDTEVLAGLGRVTIRHGQLDFALRVCVKDLAGVTAEEAIDATDRQTFRELRERVRRLARQRIGEGPALVRLDAILSRARRAAERRNELVHVLWASELYGDDYIRDGNADWTPCPSADDLNGLAKELADISSDLHEARNSGFLKKALAGAGT